MARMTRLHVTPARLQRRSVDFLGEGMQLRALGGRLDAALADAEAAVAGLATAQAIRACRAAWSADLIFLSLALADTGGDLAQAAAGYGLVEGRNAAGFEAGFEAGHAHLESLPTPPTSRVRGHEP